MKKIKITGIIVNTIYILCLTGQLVPQEKTRLIPKNIILMISDGCGYNHIDAASLYQYGKTGAQVYERFPVKYGVSTHPANGVVYEPDKMWKYFDRIRLRPTDSAASATAMATGVKTYNGAICFDMEKKPLENIVERAEKLGKATGVVSSVMFTHATPAGMVAHNKSRNRYGQIAREMILESSIDVIMGAGHPLFDNDGKKWDKTLYAFVGGKTIWQKLIDGNAGNDADGDGIVDFWKLIQNRTDFQGLMEGDTPKRVIGIPEVHETLQCNRSGDGKADPYVVPFNENIPTLEEMTRGALNILDNDPDGLFLMIEGGAIDWASHDNQAGRMIEEEIDFNKAVEAVVSWVEKNNSWEETLVIVTGDHETGYLTGPGSGIDRKPVWKPLVNNGKGKVPGMEWHSGGHTNSLLPVYAKGTGSELFRNYIVGEDQVRGEYIDNTTIGKVMLKLFGKDSKNFH